MAPGPAPPTATTRTAALVGHPVGHSLSPALHNAAFAAVGLDWVFVAFDVPEDRGEAAIVGVRALGIDGLSVTMPLKAVIAGAVDRLDPVAARLNAVNTVVREGAQLVGYNTDGDGFLDGLRADAAWGPDGARCVVLGAGGAARAVILALAGAGAAEVVVVNRTRDRAEAAAALAGPVGRVGEFTDVGAADLVVNATPIGMDGGSAGGEETTATVLGSLRGPGQLVADLVYHPRRTPLLTGAEERGATTSGGLAMLVHQAARAFRLWTGIPAPLATMVAAAQAELARRLP